MLSILSLDYTDKVVLAKLDLNEFSKLMLMLK